MEKNYPPDVREELKELGELAQSRELEERVLELAEVFDGWRAGKISTGEVSRNVQNFHDNSTGGWSDEADPGMPVAAAIAKGLLNKDEISLATWKILEILVTLADL